MIFDFSYTIVIVLCSFVVYLAATEEHFFHLIILLTKIVRIMIDRVYWMIKLHPLISNNFISKWLMYRKHLKIAKELEKEFNDKL